MQGNSSPVTSSQTQSHEGLGALLERHVAHAYRKPVASYNRTAFEQSIARWQAHGGAPLILDAGCGVGLSTMHLAAQFPDHFVIGVDQSADRIARNTHWEGTRPENFLWVRADLVDYWRLMLEAGIRPVRHYVLYPNPWPKIGQLQRRWHAHPVFPTVVALGGYFECRSNWQIYIDECGSALAQLGGGVVQSGQYFTAAPITPFESKYLESGHALWRCSTTM